VIYHNLFINHLTIQQTTGITVGLLTVCQNQHRFYFIRLQLATLTDLLLISVMK